MKIITLILTVVSLAFISFTMTDEPGNKPTHTDQNGFVPIDSKKMDVNAISTVYRTNGSYNRDPSTGNAGFEWPKGTGKTARYASGIWLGCVAGSDTLTAVWQYSDDFTAGYMNNGLPQYDSLYRIYTINKNDSLTYDYNHWPSSQGAYSRTDGKPFLIGDQTMFSSMVESRPHASGSTSDSILGAQILLTCWAYAPYDNSENPINPFSNTIFMEYRIINKSNKTWNNMWAALWTDDDLGISTDDKVGCDTAYHIGYTYNSTNNDGMYGNAPPSVGFIFLRGHLKYTGNFNDTVKYYQPSGSNNVVIKTGYKDQKMSVFNYYNGATPQPGDPMNNRETYRVLKGLWRLGDSWVNPVTHDTTTLPFSGDPVAGTGWLMPGESDRRFLMSTGPGIINPGDTLTIVAAQIIARGNSNLNSITQLRRTAKIVKNFYDNNMEHAAVITPPKVNSGTSGDGKIYLSWNDSAERKSYEDKLSGGFHKFQGYNIYQINSFSTHPSGEDTVLIKTFDIIDTVRNIYDSTHIPGYDGIFYGIVQTGTNSGITRSIALDRDTISRKNFINGTEYKFTVTAYYYNPAGGIFTLPKVRESSKGNIIRVTPQGLSPGSQLSFNYGDTIITDQKVLTVMPVVHDPLKLLTASYTTVIIGTNTAPLWTLTRNYNGTVTTLFENQNDFTGKEDTAKTADGLLLIHSNRKDSGIVFDPDDPIYSFYFPRWSFSRSWEYSREGMEWFTAPDTTAIKTGKMITNRQFQSRSLGMSFPTTGTFRNNVTRVKANSSYFIPINPGRPILTGGPLRKIKIIFGHNSMAYRFVPTDTNYTNTPFADMKTIPFSVYAADELDSSGGTLRQLNVGFMDSNNDGIWNPDTSKLGNYHFTYILASNYDPLPHTDYTVKNPGLASTSLGFPSMDVMYAWLPRVKAVNGVIQSWMTGDTLTVTPFRLTRPEFVPGYNLKFNWSVTGTQINNQLAQEEIKNIKVFPNPYYGFSELEYNDGGDKFIYISHLPVKASIYIYTLDGVPVKKIIRNTNDPESSLEKWDLKNNDGSYVASGMYIVYVDCGEFGTKTLKIAVLQR